MMIRFNEKRVAVMRLFCFGSLDRNRTCIWSFGNSYTIHCTTRPKIKIQETRPKKQEIYYACFSFGFCFLVFGFSYFINPPALPANIFTAMASNITPKNFRTASKPAGPNNFSIHFKDLRTKKTRTRFKRIATSITRSE